MIKALRVDHRLLHGQVGVSWISFLGADCLLLVTDTKMNDPLWVSSMKMAKPANTRLVVKTVEDAVAALKSGVTDKYKLFIVCETVAGAVRIVKETGIKEVNLGGAKPGENKQRIDTAFFITPEEKAMLDELVQSGVRVYMQQLPAVKPKDYTVNIK